MGNWRDFLQVIITKDCLSTGQEQACIRITQLFVCLFVRHHAKKWQNTQKKWPNTQKKWLQTAPLRLNSTWMVQGVFSITNRVFSVIRLMFSISPMFFVISMFSQITLCSPVWDGRRAQFVELWNFYFFSTFPIASVSGFILGGNFYGSIFVNHDIYYVDPSKVLPN